MTMKKFTTILCLLTLSIFVLAGTKPKTPLRQVKFETTIDCKNCVKKVTENVSFEKGVKDLKTELSDKTVTIVYNPDQTDTLKLAKAIRKLGYKANVIEDSAVK